MEQVERGNMHEDDLEGHKVVWVFHASASFFSSKERFEWRKPWFSRFLEVAFKNFLYHFPDALRSLSAVRLAKLINVTESKSDSIACAEFIIIPKSPGKISFHPDFIFTKNRKTGGTVIN